MRPRGAGGRPTVAICVATYLRPQGLTRLLESLGRLTFRAPGAPRVEIVVVDNDAERSAASVCEEMAPRLPWPLHYEHEPRRGLSYVRNHAVNRARDWADFIAFIDDDEAAEPDWLDALLRVQSAYDADVVAGPVYPRFETEAPAWVAKGKFFGDSRRQTGTAVRDPSTGNALIRTAALAGVEGPFDERFAITGGEDTHLFLRLHRAGCTMVWADEALVCEWVPESRMNARWLLRRIFRGASTWSICERELDPGLRTTALRIAKGVARIGYGAALLPVSWLLGRHMMVRSLWYVCFGAGNLAGLAGIQYREYRTIHGR